MKELPLSILMLESSISATKLAMRPCPEWRRVGSGRRLLAFGPVNPEALRVYANAVF